MRLREGRILAAAALVAGLSAGCADRGSSAGAEARARLEAEFGRRAEAPEPAREAAAAAGSQPAAGSPPMPGDAGESPASDAAADPAPPADAGASDPGASDPVPPGPAPGEVGVDSLLALADAAYAGLDRLRAAFSQRIENPLLGRTREGHGMWYQAGRNRFRMDFEVPADDIYIADGSCLWLYEPSLHDQVMVSRLDEGVELGSIDILGRLLSEARIRYDAVDAGVEAIEGTETRVVALTPRQLPARYVEVRLWIGVADHYVRRFRVREENEMVRTVTLTRLEPQAPIDTSLFAYAPPSGVQIFPGDVRCD
ncbi:LolA family protein [Candidatus Palauibacter sp.]|uniref:LolA family protein n=1 Tax=Candidatus Palauibacter sp. TaxID=3101350 RepID=UPI003B593E8A